MPKYERDTYEPDDVRVFDGGADEEEDGGSHLPVVIVISLLVLAAFGGVVWLAYNNGVAHGRADVPTQTVAQNTANEPAATAPGSGDIPTKQIKVYQQPAGADEDAGQSSPAAAPMTKAPAALQARPVEPMKAAATPPAAMTTTAKAPLKIAEKSPKRMPAKVVEAPKPATAPPAKLMPAKTAEKPVEKPVAKTVAAPAAAAAGGGYVLQIGAYKSQNDADAAWKAYQAKHVALLSGISSDVQKADLGDKGVWYRLRVGSFADKDAAAALCDRLKANGGACFPAK
ncbi:MAG: SPOR domain-containing protein [Alphaproteobacteria bacterium]|nr:SPOR domain-containing protein [Alphaproteobacteria bacterium]MDE2162035.1 SPOR domain-containing protein [Alphaproteobacteria bacterium]MDE2265391.1 SPOR domain-containing protein [Alphaproteobacteria bacterium]MDE2500275.1 SPOR domain-containing protein [Alphaproteobacteria bacterium]